MGFLEKVKNMFTEEVEETPIKKEVMQVEIPAPTPTVEEPKKTVVAESEVLVKEEKPQAPVFFDDKDFASLERKEEKKPKPKKLEDKYKGKEEEKKVFRPTPIISPVYGVLDKNYRKDDITPKKTRPITTEYDNSHLTIDDVRRKAYGTLEDDLEVIIPSDDYEITEEHGIINDEVEIQDDGLVDLDYEPRFAKKDDVIENIEDDQNENDLFEEIESKEEPLSDEEMFEELQEEKDETKEELTDSDLFNLIDSMYDKKDGE